MHWDSVYASKKENELSWTQVEPALSLALIAEVCPSGRVIAVGGGLSPLAERLADRGYTVTVLDISGAALARARERAPKHAARIQWIEADVTRMPDLGTHDVWHDRALFHFLIDAADRAAYVALLKRTIPMGGYAVIATFAPDGPEKCSGLPVRRYDAAALQAELGPEFRLVKSVPETHRTPWGGRQPFQYSVFQQQSAGV